MKETLLILLLAIVLSPDSKAQSSLEDLKPEEYFDFWIGEWKVSWDAPDGTREHGSNTVTKILEGAVIMEDFRVASGRMEGFRGQSYSVYVPHLDTWKQTWVDNSRGYLEFNAEFEGDRRIFKRSGKAPDGGPIRQRMIFYEITGNGFTWDWEVSRDGGETWELKWRIYYKRKE